MTTADRAVFDVTFRGRVLPMYMISYEQLLAMNELADVIGDVHVAYQAAVTQYQEAQATDSADLDAAKAELSARADRIIKSGRRVLRLFKGVLVNSDDYDWLMDGMADTTIQEADLTVLLEALISEMAKSGDGPGPVNRASKRAAARRVPKR